MEKGKQEQIEPGTLGFLRVSLDENKRYTYAIIKNKILTCGRDESCDIYVQDTNYISKRHFRVWCIQFDGSFDPICYVQDISLNGTYIVDSKKEKIQRLKKYQIGILQKGNRICFPHHLKTRNFDITIEYVSYRVKESPRACSYTTLKVDKIPETIGKWTFNGSVLGTGSFGVVFGCSHEKGYIGCCKLIKKVVVPITEKNWQDISDSIEFRMEYRNKNENKNPFYFKKIYRETAILKFLNHPNIVAFYESKLVLDPVVHEFQNKYFYKYANYLIYQELGTGGDLFSFLFDPAANKLKFLMEEEALVIIYQILLAVEYLHGLNIAHRDIKLDNILLVVPEPCTRVLLSDFGISKKCDNITRISRLKSCVGTPEYTAPEVGNFNKNTVRDLIQEKVFEDEDFNTKDKGYSLKCDIWSLGVLFYYLLTGKPFFGKSKSSFSQEDPQNINLYMLQEWIYKKIDSITEVNDVTESCLSFIKKMLIIDVNYRYSIDNCLNDSYITNELMLLKKIYQEKILCSTFEPPSRMPNQFTSFGQKRYSNISEEHLSKKKKL